MFENVTYTFYSSTLGRSTVPDEATFNTLAITCKLQMQQLMREAEVTEYAENGIDSAVCMMIEEQYKADQSELPEGAKVTSESIGGFSQSFDVSEVEADTKKQKQMKWIKLYCCVDPGVC
jgi:hypothetical protein